MPLQRGVFPTVLQADDVVGEHRTGRRNGGRTLDGCRGWGRVAGGAQRLVDRADQIRQRIGRYGGMAELSHDDLGRELQKFRR